MRILRCSVYSLTCHSEVSSGLDTSGQVPVERGRLDDELGKAADFGASISRAVRPAGCVEFPLDRRAFLSRKPEAGDRSGAWIELDEALVAEREERIRGLKQGLRAAQVQIDLRTDCIEDSKAAVLQPELSATKQERSLG